MITVGFKPANAKIPSIRPRWSCSRTQGRLQGHPGRTRPPVLEGRSQGAPRWLSPLSVQLLISAQIIISQFASLSPVSGSALMVRSLLGILSPSLCPSPTCIHARAHSLSQNKQTLKIKPKKEGRFQFCLPHAWAQGSPKFPLLQNSAPPPLGSPGPHKNLYYGTYHAL